MYLFNSLQLTTTSIQPNVNIRSHDGIYVYMCVCANCGNFRVALMCCTHTRTYIDQVTARGAVRGCQWNRSVEFTPVNWDAVRLIRADVFGINKSVGRHVPAITRSSDIDHMNWVWFEKPLRVSFDDVVNQPYKWPVDALGQSHPPSVCRLLVLLIHTLRVQISAHFGNLFGDLHPTNCTAARRGHMLCEMRRKKSYGFTG